MSMENRYEKLVFCLLYAVTLFLLRNYLNNCLYIKDIQPLEIYSDAEYIRVSNSVIQRELFLLVLVSLVNLSKGGSLLFLYHNF